MTREQADRQARHDEFAAEAVPRLARMGRQIRYRRNELGMTLEELAQATGVSYTQLQQIESGEKLRAGRGDGSAVTGPGVEVVFRVEQALGLSEGDLLRAGGYAGGYDLERSVLSDPELTVEGKASVLAVYRVSRQRGAGE